jgi:hypothetical protein
MDFFLFLVEIPPQFTYCTLKHAVCLFKSTETHQKFSSGQLLIFFKLLRKNVELQCIYKRWLLVEWNYSFIRVEDITISIDDMSFYPNHDANTNSGWTFVPCATWLLPHSAQEINPGEIGGTSRHREWVGKEKMSCNISGVCHSLYVKCKAIFLTCLWMLRL